MKKLILLIALLIFSNCSIDRTITEMNESEKQVLDSFKQIPDTNKLKITQEHEPGEKLLLCLTFVNKTDKTAISDQLVKFYHTSATGNYEQVDPNDESTARLSGVSKTDERGRIYLETILPGDYGSSEDKRHIHTTVFNASPEGYDIHFKQYTSIMGKNFVQGSDQHFLADLKKIKDGKLVCFVKIEVKNPKINFQN